MPLNPQIIGKDMPHGFAGCYARQPDMIVETRPAGGDAAIPFGAPLVYDDGAVVQAGASFTATTFVGVAGCEIKSALTYLDQQAGQYAPGDQSSGDVDHPGPYGHRRGAANQGQLRAVPPKRVQNLFHYVLL